MKPEEAIEICKEMQKWRRGEGIYDGESPAPMPYTPEKFGIAIDKLIGCADGHNIDELRKERDAYYERLQELRQEKAEIDEAKFESAAESYERGFAQGQEVGEREMIDKACEYLDTHILCMQDGTRSFFVENFRKAMGISVNKEEIPSKYDADYLQSKIDAFTEARKKDGKTADDILNECRGGSLELTWQDVKRIVEIADEVLDFQKMGFLATEDYGWSSEESYYAYVLEKFTEESK